MEIEDILDGHVPSETWLAGEEANRLLSEVERREVLYRSIHPRPSASHGPLLRALFAHEVAFRRNPNAAERKDEVFENLYWCALLLSQLGDVVDVLPFWCAKNIDMDTGAGFDVQFLVGAGVPETLAFLHQSADPEAERAAEHISKCEASGDFNDLEGWLQWRIDYFAPVDAS